MRKTVLTAVKQIIEEKRRQRIYPYTADVLEARVIAKLEKEEFNKQARQLLNENKIKVIRTINGFAIDLLE